LQKGKQVFLHYKKRGDIKFNFKFMYKPTLKQVEFLRRYLTTEDNSISNVCKLTGIRMIVYRNWNRSKDYRKWFDKEYTKAVTMLMFELDNICIKKADKDFRYFEILYKRLQKT